MKAIDKIIFNELASRRAITLPGIGTLDVRRQAAVMKGKEVKAPVNEVVFSNKESDNAPGIIFLMEVLGIENEQAKVAYKEWVAEVKNGEKIEIDGVGVIDSNSFSPSSELEQILNPSRAQTSSSSSPRAAAAPSPSANKPPRMPESNKKRSSNCLTNILLIITIALILILLGLYVRDNCRRKGDCINSGVSESMTENNVIAREEKIDVLVVPEVKEQVKLPVAESKKYHLIVGSFMIEANADNLVTRYARLYPNITVEKVVDYKGWILVSLFQSDNIHDAYNSFYHIADQIDNWDMWVYEKN